MKLMSFEILIRNVNLNLLKFQLIQFEMKFNSIDLLGFFFCKNLNKSIEIIFDLLTSTNSNPSCSLTNLARPLAILLL